MLIYIKSFLSLSIVILLMILIWFVLSKNFSKHKIPSESQIKIEAIKSIDYKRKLILVNCKTNSYLILTGGKNDVVIDVEDRNN